MISSLEATNTSRSDQLVNTPLSSPKPDHPDVSLSEEEKRLKRLLRNREAARRNRLKKKDWLEDLKKGNTEKRIINSQLREKIQYLEEELMHLERMSLVRI